MPQSDVVPVSAPRNRLLLPKTVQKVSIVEHFEVLTTAIRSLVQIEEALHNASAEDLAIFLDYAKQYRNSISNQWLNLQKSLGWLRVEGDVNNQYIQETDVSATYQKEDHSPISHTHHSSFQPWTDCPDISREQMAGLIHVLQAQRREMDDLHERLADLEEVYEESIIRL